MPNRKERYIDMLLYKETRNAQRKRYYNKTAKYGRRNWTNEEDELVLLHEIPDMELSRKISRSVEAIQIRRSRLNKVKIE